MEPSTSLQPEVCATVTRSLEYPYTDEQIIRDLSRISPLPGLPNHGGIIERYLEARENYLQALRERDEQPLRDLSRMSWGNYSISQPSIFDRIIRLFE